MVAGLLTVAREEAGLKMISEAMVEIAVEEVPMMEVDVEDRWILKKAEEAAVEIAVVAHHQTLVRKEAGSKRKKEVAVEILVAEEAAMLVEAVDAQVILKKAEEVAEATVVAAELLTAVRAVDVSVTMMTIEEVTVEAMMAEETDQVEMMIIMEEEAEATEVAADHRTVEQVEAGMRIIHGLKATRKGLVKGAGAAHQVMT